MTAKEFYLLIRENKTIEEIMIEFARIKCVEAIRNTRYKAIDIINECPRNGANNVIVEDVTRKIQNISNQEVMPEL